MTNCQTIEGNKLHMVACIINHYHTLAGECWWLHLNISIQLSNWFKLHQTIEGYRLEQFAYISWEHQATYCQTMSNNRMQQVAYMRWWHQMDFCWTKVRDRLHQVTYHSWCYLSEHKRTAVTQLKRKGYKMSETLASHTKRASRQATSNNRGEQATRIS